MIYTFNEDNKNVRDNKGKAMKQSEFQETVLEMFSKISNRLDKLEDFVEKQSKFNEFISGEIAFLKKFHKDNL